MVISLGRTRCLSFVDLWKVTSYVLLKISFRLEMASNNIVKIFKNPALLAYCEWRSGAQNQSIKTTNQWTNVPIWGDKKRVMSCENFSRSLSPKGLSWPYWDWKRFNCYSEWFASEGFWPRHIALRIPQRTRERWGKWYGHEKHSSNSLRNDDRQNCERLHQECHALDPDLTSLRAICAN